MIKQKLLPPLTSVNQGGRKEVSTVARERRRWEEVNEAVAQVEATLQRRQSVGQVKVYKPAKKAGRQAGRQGNACCGCCLIFSVLWQGAPCNTHTPHNKAEHKKARQAGRRGGRGS